MTSVIEDSNSSQGNVCVPISVAYGLCRWSERPAPLLPAIVGRYPEFNEFQREARATATALIGALLAQEHESGSGGAVCAVTNHWLDSDTASERGKQSSHSRAGSSIGKCRRTLFATGCRNANGTASGWR